ncbi:MAG: MBL fold metallo-hydrolase [Actinobacteria bacterium HGW-Actinobacteria-4]|nr:MAG: MBL fold metallo-hydrolase [Actinobacteria bacterium HGW-Actinobacteria-4]
MRLTVVGCSGSVPGPASPASCYLVEADDDDGRTWTVALDLGSGALGPLQTYCDPRDLDAVLLSHLHPDHCADLAPLHVYLAHHPDGPSHVRVVGPFGTTSRVNELRGTEDPSEALGVEVWLDGAAITVGPLSIRCESVTHPVPAYALRIEGPSEREARSAVVLAYSGDADVCEGLDRAAAGADVFLCEATFTEAEHAPRGSHLTGARAGEVAQAARVDRLLLTHVPPWSDPNTVIAEASRTFSGPLEVAQPGRRIEL